VGKELKRGGHIFQGGPAVLAVWAFVLLLGTGGLAHAEPSTGAVTALQAKRTELVSQLRASAFGEPVVLNSREGSARVEGDVYAEVDYSIAQVGATFNSPVTICEFLFLHLNVHACERSTAGSRTQLTLEVGPKRSGAAGATYRMDYELRIEAVESTYLRVTLEAAKGPLSTSDYRIAFEAVPLEGGRSFVHLGYAYSFGFMAKVAMQAYLATAGRSKIGFTVIGLSAAGQPIYVRGERAALERNVVRYYLALLAHCATSGKPPQERTEARLRAWFALTERYAAQLHEFDLNEYLHEKHDDLARSPADGK
jgi:hypothetical protein